MSSSRRRAYLRAQTRDVKVEETRPNPQCFYTLTKWMAEEMIGEVCPTTLIPRIRLPLSEVPHPRNTITKILGYSRLVDTKESVTVVEDFVAALLPLMESGVTGPVNMVNGGLTSAVDIAEAFGKSFDTFTRSEFSEQMELEGRAHRVSTIVSSTRIPLLPDIATRLPEVVRRYKECPSNV